MTHNKILYLEGLRGLAALTVVLSHFMFAFYPAVYTQNLNDIHTAHQLELWIGQSPLNLFYSGHFAVCVFFVLSGFVLTAKFFQTKESDLLIIGAIKRYFRLTIPVIISLFIAYMILSYHLFYNQKAAPLTHSMHWLYDFWNFTPDIKKMLYEGLYGVFINETCTYNKVLWTMTYEFYGSLLTFSTAILIGNLRHRYIIYSLIIGLTLQTYYFMFILGVFISDLIHKAHFIKQKQHSLLSYTLLFIGLFLGSYPTLTSYENSIYNFMALKNITTPTILYHGIGAFLMILSLSLSKKLQIILCHRIFQFLGKISFSLYIIHLIFLSSISCFIFIHVMNYLSYMTAVFVTFFLSIGPLLFISYLMYKFIDKPSTSIAQKIYDRYFKPKACYPCLLNLPSFSQLFRKNQPQ